LQKGNENGMKKDKKNNMNTIKDLAVQWWESLPIKRNIEFLSKYHFDESFNYNKIENIFYNEVILNSWWHKLDTNKQIKLINHYFNGTISSEEDYKVMYVKEHSKPTVIDELTEIGKETIDTTLKIQELMVKEKLMTALCEDGSKLTFDAQGRLQSVQSLSVNKDVEVDEEHECKYCGEMTIQSDDECYAKPKVFPAGTVVRDMYNLAEDEFDKPCYIKLKDGKWALGSQKYFSIGEMSIGENKRFKLVYIPPQPKVEDNSWDEASFIYQVEISSVRTSPEDTQTHFIDFINWAKKQHYTLIKKQ